MQARQPVDVSVISPIAASVVGQECGLSDRDLFSPSASLASEGEIKVAVHRLPLFCKYTKYFLCMYRFTV